MTLYERYLSGETKSVYADIESMGHTAFSKKIFPDIENVLNETFKRVAFNLDIIYHELVSINYLFKKSFNYNFEMPLHKPLADTEQLLKILEKSLRPFGFIPQSLKTFYRIVGGCNFGWDYDTNEDYKWTYADPIQITSLDALISEFTDNDYLADMKDEFKDEGFLAIPISADFYHKDNTSGGPPYALKLTQKPSIDGQFLNEENNTTFIDYLRICFDNCGFSRISKPENNNDYQSFFDKVRPQLRKI
ncbi:MAG TPA: hypothetical protein VK622_03990 [Puia sp.]|nr:hypothetical protein [Puia sp.]